MPIKKESPVDLSVIIVAFNVKDLVRKCLNSLRLSKDTLQKEIIYVENGSTDGTAEMVEKEFPEVKIITTPVNLGFVKANNLGYESANGKYILMLNSDAFVGKNTLQTLTGFLDQHPDCGIVGCNAVNNEGEALPSARTFPTPWRLFLTQMGWAGKLPFWKDINDQKEPQNTVRECDWVTGCCLMVRKEITDTFDYFLRPDLFMYNDDNDLCLRVKKKGWKVHCLPETIIHLAGANNKKIMKDKKDDFVIKRMTVESELVYFRQNYNLFWVFQHVCLQSLYETMQLIKNMLLLRGTPRMKKNLKNLAITFDTLKRTNFGNTSIERNNKIN